MPNIASVLKDEIARLAKKEIRKEIEGLRKSSAQYRSEISDLKRRVASLEKAMPKQEKRRGIAVALETEIEDGIRLRFSASRFAAQRGKLGVSAGQMGTLLGVSAQTVYNWESGKTRPRQQQLAAIAALRKIGKKELQTLLAS